MIDNDCLAKNCPANQVFLNNTSSCQETCSNLRNYKQCDLTNMCGCSEGTVLREDVYY